MNIKTFVLAAGLVTVASSQAVAQGRTDSPNTGSGAALTSTVVFISPFAFSFPPPLLGGAGGDAYMIIGPGGSPVAVALQDYVSVSDVIYGRPAGAGPQPALVQAFGGGPQATALVQALQTLAAERTSASLAAAIRAYNAAVNAGPENPPGALLTVRAFLSSMIR